MVSQHWHQALQIAHHYPQWLRRFRIDEVEAWKSTLGVPVGCCQTLSAEELHACTRSRKVFHCMSEAATLKSQKDDAKVPSTDGHVLCRQVLDGHRVFKSERCHFKSIRDSSLHVSRAFCCSPCAEKAITMSAWGCTAAATRRSKGAQLALPVPLKLPKSAETQGAQKCKYSAT
jgi:hypothetical protein